MPSSTQVLIDNKFQNVSQMIAAASMVGLPLWVAAAFVEAESMGQNIYGHDAGGVFAGRGTVTSVNYTQFYDLVVNQHKASNGVGPMQITWPGFLVDAAKRGIRLWNSVENFTYGFRLIAGFLGHNYTYASIAAAGAKYNGSSAYGQAVANRAVNHWHSLMVPTVLAGPAVLQLGSSGNAVRSLQNGLNRVFPAYSHLTADGKFGSETERVITEFETRSHIVVDGVVGPVVRSRLNAVGITF